VPFIFVVNRDRKLMRVRCSHELVELAEDRLDFWLELKHLAGDAAPEVVHDAIELELETELGAKLDALRAEYEAKIAELKARYPALIARKLAEGLITAGNGSRTIGELLAEASTLENVRPIPAVAPQPEPAAEVAAPAAPVAVATAPAVETQEEDDEELGMEPYIDTERCTTCNDCTNINNKLFAYNDKKQAYIKDARAGTFKQIVMAAEKCPVAIIHPGTPLNPKEKGLEKLIERAAPFN